VLSYISNHIYKSLLVTYLPYNLCHIYVIWLEELTTYLLLLLNAICANYHSLIKRLSIVVFKIN